MIEITGDDIAGLLLPAWFIFGAIYIFWGIRRKKKRFKNGAVVAPRKSDCKDESICSLPPNTSVNEADSLTRESIFKDVDSYRPDQGTAFDRSYAFDQPAYMEHNINGVPMMGGVDLQGNPFGTYH